MKRAPAAAVLGIDLGASSIGWALCHAQNEELVRIVRLGVRVFDAGVEGQFETGRTESRNVARRSARLLRRGTDRRARRLARVFHLLQKAALLPLQASETLDVSPDAFASMDDRDQRHHLILKLDRDIRQSFAARPGEEFRDAHLLPYRLRAQALDKPLRPFEFGRALYHLAQRRGFLSNRKSPAAKDEDLGKVKAAISQLEADMNQAGVRTLGEFFSTLDPTECRIRARWTARSMYEAEFHQIWQAQAVFHPALLTEELRQQLFKAIFFQRPLKSQSGLIGRCELEPKRRRTPWADLDAQRFRLLQQVNHTSVILTDGELRPLAPEERSKLIDALDRNGDLTFTAAKRLLKPSKILKFSFEAGGESRFVGNRTNAGLVDIFGDAWWTFSDDKKRAIVADLRSIQKPEVLQRRGKEAWKLSQADAKRFADLELEGDYCRLSRKAIRNLLPHLEKGVSYAEAVQAAYPQRAVVREPIRELPPVFMAVPELRNPAVARALTELRKVVNAVVAAYGRPDAIRIELARDLRKNKKQREESWKLARRNEAARKKAAERIVREAGIANPTRTDIQKVLLADECGWICPYTGRGISMASLVGPNPQFDMEHIAPFSRSLDDSFLNLTLCHHEENRNVKRNRTPSEAYGHSPDRYAEILERVKRFKGNAAAEKLRRFRTEDVELDDFVARQLNDTRYASVLAMDYLGLLYGGPVDASGTRRVQAGRGGVTFCLRNAWGLNDILGDGGSKSRDDHRHHAVDAVVTALTTPATIKHLSDAAARSDRPGRFSGFPEPWPGFHQDVRQAVLGAVVSRRVSKRVNGPLHRETFYGLTAAERKVRKPLATLSLSEMQAIIDPRVRELVLGKFHELGGGDPARCFADTANHPVLPARDGRSIPIHSARIRKADAVFAVGKGARCRHVASESNHHVEVLEVRDDKGRPKWEGVLVSRFEAMQRRARHLPVVQRDHGPDRRFLFSLAPGEVIECDSPDGRLLRVVRSVSRSIDKAGRVNNKVEYAPLSDARIAKEIKAARLWKTSSPNELCKLDCRKVTINALGEVRRAND